MEKVYAFIQTKFLRPIRVKAVLKILNKLPSGSILDVGCMDDYLLKRLPKKFDYFGVDSDPLCKNPRIIKSSIENFPKNKKYDIVICTEVLEHLPDPVAAIRKLKALSKRFILISVPNEPFFSLGRLFFPAKKHLWTIFPWALKKYLGKPVLERKNCFNRTYTALWDLKKEYGIRNRNKKSFILPVSDS